MPNAKFRRRGAQPRRNIAIAREARALIHAFPHGATQRKRRERHPEFAFTIKAYVKDDAECITLWA